MTIITEGELRLLAAESAIQVALTGLGDIRTRITTLEARCLENERRETASRWWSETKQAPSPVDDHRGKERPVKPPPELVRCAAWETCDDPHCNGHKGLHSRRSVCVEPCHGGTICIPVPAQEPKLSEQWRCPAVNCYHHYGAAWCRHGKDHEWRHDCAEFCCCNRCIPVPEPAIPDQITIDSMSHMEPEPAIPATPESVGTEEAILIGREFARALEKYTLDKTPADGDSVTVSAIFGYRAGQWQIISGVYTEKGA